MAPGRSAVLVVLLACACATEPPPRRARPRPPAPLPSLRHVPVYDVPIEEADELVAGAWDRARALLADRLPASPRGARAEAFTAWVSGTFGRWLRARQHALASLQKD